MMKLTLTKSREFKTRAELLGIVRQQRRPACEMMIHGMGRLRTAQMHSNFHVVEIVAKDRVQMSESPKAKKSEIVYVR